MPQDQVTRLVEILARLRAPGGCPWDREQTHQSLKYYMVEETGEFLDAVDDNDPDAMADELGDLLLQIVFHCQIASEHKRFGLQDVARICCEKMVRRHPHVFADTHVQDADGVVDQWEQIKRAEKGDRQPDSAVSSVPRHLPALHRAQKIQKRAAKVGFEWPTVDGALAKVDEELAELRDALHRNDDDAAAEETGDLLFAVVNLSRYRSHYAEDLLHGTVRKFEHRFRTMEALLARDGKQPEDCAIAELEAAWNAAKQENQRPT